MKFISNKNRPTHKEEWYSSLTCSHSGNVGLAPVILSLYQECSQIPVNDIILFWGVVAKQTQREAAPSVASRSKPSAVSVLSQQTWTPAKRNMPNTSPQPPSYPNVAPHPHLLFLPLSLFLKAWLHHPQCPHFNNACEISHWLQDMGGEAGMEKACRMRDKRTTARIHNPSFVVRQQFETYQLNVDFCLSSPFLVIPENRSVMVSICIDSGRSAKSPSPNTAPCRPSHSRHFCGEIIKPTCSSLSVVTGGRAPLPLAE